MKTLTKEAVLQTAEQLIAQYGTTTTLDVKNRLRNNGYHAVQADVSAWMEKIAIEENWLFAQKNQYKVYRFGEDTEAHIHQYLEKEEDFWEIEVVGKTQTIFWGKIGTDGESKQWNYPTNRKAIRESDKILNEQIKIGFLNAIDLRLPKTIRLKFGQYLQQIPIKCSLGYFNIEKIEQEAIHCTTSEGEISGKRIFTTSMGCRYEWELPLALAQLRSILQNEVWSYENEQESVQLYLLGQKTKPPKIWTEDGVEISQKTIQTIKPQAEKVLKEWKMPLEKLYAIEFVFQDNQKIQLSKFDLSITNELIPIAQKILNNFS